MIEFLKSYGIWIVVGVFLLVMLVRSRGHAGGGCGMSGTQRDNSPQNPSEEKKEEQHKHSGCC